MPDQPVAGKAIPPGNNDFRPAAAQAAPGPSVPTLSCSVEPSKLIVEQPVGSVRSSKVTVTNRGSVSVYISWFCHTRHARDTAANAPGTTPRTTRFFCAIDSTQKAAML